MFLVCLIVAVLVGLVAWCWLDAPNALPPTPQRRHKEFGGW
jgi:hypothetical protein